MPNDPSSTLAKGATHPQIKLSSPPVLSVGLPVCNGEKWIVDAIESFLEQSFGDFELIISDNASTDHTEAICCRFAERDQRIRYHRNSNNIGIYRNFDQAFELSSGKYFKWAADSDYCLDGFFEKCVDVLEARPDVVLAYTRAYLLSRDLGGNEVATEYFDDFNLEDEQPSVRFSKYLNREKINNIMHGVIRTSALQRTSLNRPLPGSDISMIAELSLLGKFVEIPDRLFVRRFDPETSTILRDRSTAAMREMPHGNSFWQRVNLHTYRFISTFRSPISFSEKMHVWLFLLRRAVKVPPQLIGSVFRKVITGR